MYDIIRIIMTLKKKLLVLSVFQKNKEKYQKKLIHTLATPTPNICRIWMYVCRKILRIISFTLHERNPFFVMPFLCRK